MTTCPNLFPSLEPPGISRIAIIGDCPDALDIGAQMPFAGRQGEFLASLLSQAGLVKDQCFLGHVFYAVPEGGDFNDVTWNSIETQESIETLKANLSLFSPSIIFCLGNAALHLFKEGNVPPHRRGREYAWKNRINSWRGSLFWSEWLNVKCLASLPIPSVLKDFSLQPYMKFDVKRLAGEAKTRELEWLPEKIDIWKPNGGRSLYQILRTLNDISSSDKAVAVDIEGHAHNITCIAFAWTPHEAVVIPFAHADGTSAWTEEEETALWTAIKAFLENPKSPKILQNGLYDAFALAWGYGIVIRNFSHDTMIAFWECFAELKKGLATQASILTKQPFYKPDKTEEGEMKFDSDDDFWRYNGIDACVTYECWEKEMALMTDGQKSHYAFNMSLMPILLYMELRGMRYDTEAAEEARQVALQQVWEMQAQIDHEAAMSGDAQEIFALESFVKNACNMEANFAQLCLRCLCGKAPKEKVEVIEERWQPMKWNGKKWVKDGKLLDAAQSIMLRVHFPCVESNHEPALHGIVWLNPKHKTILKSIPFTPITLSSLEPHILDSKQEEWRRVKQIWKQLTATHNDQTTFGRNRTDGPRARGDNRHVEDSTKNAQGQTCLLGELATLLSLSLNVGSTQEDGDAQKFLYEICGFKKQFKRKKGQEDEKVSSDQNALVRLYATTEDVRVLWVLQLRRLRKLASDLALEVDEDGRLRSTFSLVKETGRMSASESPTGKGTNAQALNKDLRYLIRADEGCEYAQLDLEGADSWTVACECASLGDRTMLEDLQAGLKPAKVLTLLYAFGEEVNTWTREQIKKKLKEYDAPKWLYPACKSATHGSSYCMGVPTMIQSILKFSMADLPMKLEDAKPLVLEYSIAKKLQEAFFTRYAGVRDWHAKTGKNLMKKGELTFSTGHVRRFYGRKMEKKKGEWVPNHETLKEMLASAPQYWTTYAIKQALLKCWSDPENRRPDGSLSAEPCYVVHDSLNLMWRKEDSAWARAKSKEWFNNPVQIAGETVVIPADGAVGDNWRLDSKKGDRVEKL